MERSKYIGGSDIAAICGVNPYKTPMQVYAEKLGLAAPFQGNERTRTGQELESFVVDVLFKKIHPLMHESLTDSEAFIDEEYPFMGGTPDRIGSSSKHNDVPGSDLCNFILEVKTCGYHSFKKYYDTDEPPDFVVCQANWYAMLAGPSYKSIWIVVLGDTHLYKEWNIPRDEHLIQVMRDQAISFWNNNILSKTPPSTDGSEHCTKALAAIYPKHLTQNLDKGTQGETQILLDLKSANEELSIAKERVSSLENKLRASIGSRMGIETDICRVTWKDQEKVSLNRKDLLNDPEIKKHVTPEITSKYTKVTQMKVLRKKWL